MKIFKRLICFLLSTMLLYGCTRSEYTTYAQVEEKYQKIQMNTGLENNQAKEEVYAAYADLFESIAHGSSVDQDKFAQLIREIIGDDVVFANEDVFAIAQDYATIYSKYAAGDQDQGVQELKVKNISNSVARLDFSYWAEMWYSVKMIPEGTHWTTGEFSDPYKGELGKYLAMIQFHDTTPSMKFLEDYPMGIDHKLHISHWGSDHELTMRIISNPDHGYNIYIGSDDPFWIEEQSSVRLNRLIGTVSVTLNFST